MARPAKSVITNEIQKKKTSMNHIFLIDWDDTGLLKEIAVMKEAKDGTIYGIDVNLLHPIDKARLKKIISSVHADKYELYDLMSQTRLNNGMNALDFFYANYMKVKRPRGSVIASSFADTPVSLAGGDQVIGSEFGNDPSNFESIE